MTLARAGRPLWSEGMLVCPQHMQQQDLYHEQHLDTRLRALDPTPWGALSLAFDRASLTAGVAQLSAFSGVLPDGTAITFDGGAARPPSRPIAGHFPAHGDTLAVYLALPLLREGIANSPMAAGEGEGGGALHRYRGVVRRVFDLTLARNEREVAVSEPALQLLFDGEPRDDATTLKIAELVRDGAGGFALAKGYIPPALAIGAAPELRAAVQGLLGQALTRRRRMTEERRAVDRGQLEITARELDKTFFLHALDCHLPWLRHCADEPRTPPRILYHALLNLAGALFTVAESGDLGELPGYHPDDLAATFEPLLEELRRLLQREFDPVFIEVPLEVYQGSSWVGRFRDERLLHCTTFVLLVEVDGDLVAASTEIPEVTKIASWSRISAIVRLNALGVPLRATLRPPAEVPTQARQVCFRIDTSDPLWEELVAERKVAIVLRAPYDPQRARVRLLGIPGREG